MATFNPDVPKSDFTAPLNLSHPISDIRGNQAGGKLLGDIGDVASSATKTADFFVKSDLDDKIHESIDKEREEFSGQIKTAQAVIQPQPGAPVNVLDVTPGAGGTPQPQDLKKLPYSLDLLSSARANGKISETNYYSRLDSLAKDFRSRYPGYRDYIDQKFESVSGVNPANAEIKSRLGDINSYLAQAHTQANRIDTFAQSHLGIPGMNSKWEQYKTGQDPGGIGMFRFASQWLENNEKFKQNALILADWKGSEEKRQVQAYQTATDRANFVGNRNLSTITFAWQGNNIELTDFINKASKGEIKPKPEDWEAIQQVVTANSLAVQKYVKDELMSTKINPNSPDDQRTVWGTLSEAQRKDVVANSVKTHNDYHGAVTSKDVGLMGSVARSNENMLNKALEVVINDPQIGPPTLLAAGVSKAAGPQFAAAAYLSVIKGLMPPITEEKVKALSNRMLLSTEDVRQQLPPPSPNNPSGAITPKDTSLKTSLGKLPADAPAEAYKAILDLPKHIGSSELNDKTKINLIENTFRETGVIGGPGQGISPDAVKNGRRIPGSMSTFTDILAPDVIKEVKRLDGQKPGLWATTKDWAEKTFAFEVFPKELADVGTIASIPELKVAWDNVNHKLIKNVVYPSQDNPAAISKFYSATTQADLQNATRVIDNLNRGLTSMSNIATADGGDVNSYLLKVLKDSGADMAGVSFKDSLLKSLDTANRPKKTAQ